MRPLITCGNVLLCAVTLSVVAHLSTILLANAQTMELRKNCTTLSPPGKYPDYQPMPKYSVQRREPESPPGTGLLLGISVPADAINSGALTRLACRLGSDFPTQQRVDAYIFDDEKAARNLAIYYTEQQGYSVYLWHFKARYTLDRNRGVEFIEYVLPTLEDGLLSLRRAKIWLSRSPTENQRGQAITNH